MARETKHTGILGDLQRLSGTMDANKEQLPQMEPFRLKLTGILTQALDAARQQAALKVTKQESSKQLRKLLSEGQRVANVVRTAVKDHFGPREEKVAEFGIQPFRGRKVKPATATPTPSTTPPASEKPAGTLPPAPAGPATSIK
ncbi:MAG TPA: hypothetical protein VIA62_13200 [Thermoanaerobaculia bacterium]|nr:hypothetical protein [Thermoanaerobaculia bacterium]